MIYASLFLGDEHATDLALIQNTLYSYSLSLIISRTRKIYLGNDKSVLFFDKQALSAMRCIKKHDHRLVQPLHDTYAAVFRYQYLHGKYAKTLFDPDEFELMEKFSTMFIDINFVPKIEERYLFLVDHWFDFIENVLETNYHALRALSLALFNYGIESPKSVEMDRKAWDSAFLALDIIKGEHDYIPWYNPSKINNYIFEYGF